MGNIKDSHQALLAKDKEQDNLKNFFGIDDNWAPGNEFEWEEQEKTKLQKKYEIELKKNEVYMAKREEKKYRKNGRYINYFYGKKET